MLQPPLVRSTVLTLECKCTFFLPSKFLSSIFWHPLFISEIITGLNCSAHECHIQAIISVLPDIHSRSLFLLHQQTQIFRVKNGRCRTLSGTLHCSIAIYRSIAWIY